MLDELMICNEDGCNEPRMVSRTGKMLTKCHTHMKRYWTRKKTPNPQGRGRPQRQRKASKPAVVPAASVIPSTPKTLKVVLVDHGRDLVQRFDVPVLSGKKLSSIRDSAKLLDLYRMTGHVVVEVGKKE